MGENIEATIWLVLGAAKMNKLHGKMFLEIDAALAACFEGGLVEELVKALAKRKPLRLLFCDVGFSNDAVKINVGQIFRSLSPDTEVKVN
jgi:adenine-specific DNA-methyltransferase